MAKRQTGRKQDPTPKRGVASARTTRGLRSMLLESSPDALVALDANGNILLWNAGAAAVYGYAKDEAMGAHLASLVAAPERVQEFDQVISEAVESGLAIRETVHRRKDGSAIYVNMTVKAVRGRSGDLEPIVVSHKDVTQLKVLNHGKMLEARYRGLLESVPDAIVMVNNTGRIVLINGQAESLFSYTRDELMGQPIEILLPQRFRADHVGHRTRYFSDVKTRTMGAGLELFACRKDGAEFPVEISLSPLRTEEETFAMSAIRDISDRKKLQEELRRKNDELEQQNRLIQQANRLKSEFLANMSHELRTPLNGIIGFAEIMHDERVGSIAANHKEFLQDILTSARHLLQLINDVLDLSKIEAGKLEMIPERIDPVVVVGEVRDIVRTLAASKRIKLKAEIDPSLGTVESDSRRLKQVLYNYVSNAIKFTPDEGQVTVRVKRESAAEFRVEVEDTGVGIRPEDLNRLFVEFQQLDATSSKQYAGTGLGLALTRHLVEAQGGRVGVTSTFGKGSLFHATLPLVFGPVPASTEERKMTAMPPGSLLILVIEDDANERAWLAAALGGAGYAVETVATGAEALMRCRERRFDAITLDIMLPDMNGRAVLANLRQHGLNQQTPVIIVTLLPQKGIVAGFEISDILSKPVSQSELLSALERCGVAASTPRPILVVDDDEPSLRLADEMLSRLGYRTACHQDAASALRAASNERPAAVVLDLVMPEITGFEFLKHFRNTPNGRRTPVIVWTGKDLTDSERRQLRSAATAITKKTEQAGELVREIQSILQVPGPLTAPLNQ